MYADDTTLYCNLVDRNYTEVDNVDINNKLKKINTWLTSNKLDFTHQTEK